MAWHFPCNFSKILRRHAELVGLKSNFTILDTDDQIRLIKQVLQAENIDDKRWPARAFAMRLDSWKIAGSPQNKSQRERRKASQTVKAGFFIRSIKIG